MLFLHPHFWSSFSCCSSFVDVLHFVVVLHSHFLFDVIPYPSVDFHLVFTPISYFQAQPIEEWFATFSFSTIPLSSCRERYGLQWAFFTHRGFLTYTPLPTFLTCIYQGFPRGRQFLLDVCRASYWSWSVCLIHSNPQSLYSKRFSFKFYHILPWIACGESLIYLLLTHFELLSVIQSHIKKHFEQN